MKHAADKHLLVFLHIPKTAGTTFKRIMARVEPEGIVRKADNAPKNFDKARASMPRLSTVSAAPGTWAIRGHIPYAFAPLLPSHAEYMTLLRKPVDRAISHYYHLLRTASELSNDGFCDSFEGAFRQSAGVLDNLQVRMLCDAERPFEGPATAEMLAQAKRNVTERLAFVGLTERLDESLVMLNERFSWTPSAYVSERIAVTRPRGAAIPAELLELATRHNELDRELYEFAAARFHELVNRQGPDFAVEVAALRAARDLAQRAGEPEDPAVRERSQELLREMQVRDERARRATEKRRERRRQAKPGRRATPAFPPAPWSETRLPPSGASRHS